MTTNLLDQTNDDQVRIDPAKNYLEELVGDGKKFQSPEDLAKGKFISDGYIKILEQRLDEMRDDYIKVKNEAVAGPKLEELMTQLIQKQQLASRENTNNSNEDQNKASYNPKEVEDIAVSQFQKMRQTEKEQSNYDLVMEKVTERYGNNYKNVLKDQAVSLGLTDDKVNSMARENPNLFFKTFDLNVSKNNESFQTPPQSQMRSDNFAPRSEKRTMSYYENLKKKDPMVYYDRKIAVQMDKDSQELGEAFFDV